MFCFCLTGLAVYHTNETPFPHRLSRRRLPLRRQRDWHCAEGSGTMAWTLKVNRSDFAIPAATSSTYFIYVAFRSKWRRSELQRITSERYWRGPKRSTSRRHTAFHPGAPPRTSWKSSPFAPENCLRSGLMVEYLIKWTVSSVLAAHLFIRSSSVSDWDVTVCLL